MLFNVAFFSSLLLIPVVLAVPHALGASVARLRERRLSQPGSYIVDAVSDTQYYSSWAGASLSEGNGTLSWVTATFTVPTTSGSTGASVAAWVSIDIIGCGTGSFLLSGVTFTVSSNGQPEYSAFYQWGSAAQYPSGIAISAGDVIRLTVFAFTATSGEARIENLTNGNTVSENLTSSIPLCLQGAEWMVEDIALNLPLANFGTVAFTDAVAGGILAGTYTPSGSNVSLIDMVENNQVVASTSASGSSVTIKYV